MTNRSQSMLVALNIFLLLSAAPVGAHRVMSTANGMEMALVGASADEDEFDAVVAGADVCEVLQKRFDKQESKLNERAEQGKKMNKLGPMIRVFSAAKTKKRAVEKKCEWVNTPKSKDSLEATVTNGMKEYSNCYDQTMEFLEKGELKNAIQMYMASDTCEIQLQSGVIDDQLADAMEVEAEERCQEEINDALAASGGSLIELDEMDLDGEEDGKLSKGGAIALLVFLCIFFWGIMFALAELWLLITLIMCAVNNGKRGDYGQCMGYYWNWPERVR